MTSHESSSAHDEPEDALVKRARGGDKFAFDRLIDRHGPDLLRYVTRLTGHRDEALDVFQDTFFQAFRSIGSLKDVGAFRAWIATIATNLVRKRQSRARLDPEPLFDEPQDDHVDDSRHRAMTDSRASQLRDSLDGLPARQRAVLSLRLEVGLPFQKIGEVLGISEENARAHHYQALKSLKRQMPHFAKRYELGDLP